MFAKNILRMDVVDNDPGKRFPYISNALYDRYTCYTVVYFYRGNEKQSLGFGKILNRYSKESWLKIESYSLDRMKLPGFFSGSEIGMRSNAYLDYLEKAIYEYFGSEFVYRNKIKKSVRLLDKKKLVASRVYVDGADKLLYKSSDYFSGEEYISNIDRIKTPALFIKIGGNVNEVYLITAGAISYQELTDIMNKTAEKFWEDLYSGPKSKCSFVKYRYPKN